MKWDLVQGAKRMFVLERVNKSYESTILGSGHLMRRMGFYYTQMEELDLGSISAVLAFLLNLMDSNLELVHISEATEEMTRINLDLAVSPLRLWSNTTGQRPFGHKLKITSVKPSLRIAAFVRVRLRKGKLSITSPSYEEFLELRTGEGTWATSLN